MVDKLKINTVVFIFTNLFHVLVGYTDLGNLGCSDTVYNSKCAMNETCLVQCNFPCHKTDNIEIWGSVIYSYDSPICKAAVHDLRISTWNSNARRVLLKRVPHYTLFYGSTRFGFKSSQHSQLKRQNQGSIVFLSPRVSEEILDVFSVHRNYLFEKNQNHTQQCFIAYDERKIHFDTYSERRYIPEDMNRDPPAVVIGNTTKYEINWPPDLNTRTSAGFQCVPEKSMLSIVTSLAMRKDAYFLPDTLTVTVNYGEKVILTMNELKKEIFQTTWKKDINMINSDIPQRKGSRTSLILPEVQIGSAGIYSLEYRWVADGTLRRGIIRLIVRACPKKKFGDNCTYDCPKCQNGGVCHDITGICVCPPGFNGTLCGNACEPGSFGHMCNMRCSKNEIFDGKNVSCQGLLICLPDPYGCSCAPGFKSISCDVACSPGEYGAGCSQSRDCHCASGNSCDIYSGLCYNGCDEGWHGPACNISYPVLRQRPNFFNATATSITFTFRQWNESIDDGVGTPSSYLIVFKEVNQSERWTNWSDFDSKSFDDVKTVTISHLKKGTSYIIAIIIFDVSGEKQFENITTLEYSTLCDKAESVPVDIETEATETQVNITWKLPPKTTWNCQSVSVWLMYESRDYSEKLKVRNSFYTFRTKPFTLWNITICLAPENNHLISNCTDPLTVISQEGTPGPPSDIQYKSLEPRVVKLSWTPPVEENGIIRNYVIRYQQIAWTHTCNLPTDLDVQEINATSNSAVLSSLKPSSYYYVNISAVTLRRGPGIITNIETEMDNPDGVARDIVFLKLSNRILWSAPQCNVSYGDVTFYKVSISGQSAWDLSERDINITTAFLDPGGLLPFSNYSVKIYVANKHGISKNYSEHIFKTKADVPLQPSDLTVFSRTSNGVSFSWRPPYPPYGQLEHYTIRYGVVQEIISSIAVDPTNAVCKDTIRKHRHCFSITGLETNQEYKIGVKAFNVEVDGGSPFTFVFTRTIESVPDAPNSVSVNNRTDSSIELQWEEPYVTNGNLTNFRVNITILESFSASYAGFDSLTNITDGKVRHYMFTNLAPATVYKSCVEASTEAGFGRPNCFTFNTSNIKPVIETVPLLLGKAEEKIVIKIFAVKASGGPISAYLIIVNPVSVILRSKRHVSPNMLKTIDCPSESHSIMTKYIAAKIYDVPEDGVNVTIGDGKCENGFYNAPLKLGVTYKIGIAVVSVFGNEVKYSDIKYMLNPVVISHQVAERGTHYTGAIFGFIVPLLLIIILIAIFIYLKRPKWLYGNRRLKAMKMMILPKRDEALFSASNEVLAEEMEDEDIEIETESLSDELSNRIPVKQLETFVQKGLLNGVIKKEYMSLPRGQKFACDHAKIPVNKVKNRYGNLLPYDRTRVILKIAARESNSDYINANYIDGYKYAKKYIAAQGPKQETIDDFWRMVWGEGSCKILMTTNLTEGGKSKCTKYWPDSQQIEMNPFDDFTVSFTEVEQYADFVIRTFYISKDQESREVKQFHFQTWPDHGIPMYSPPVVSYIKKVSLYQPDNKKPIIVHCSAGIGRTGTVILLDSMIHMGKAEGHVDLLCHLNVMRRQRSNIVENLDQYIFVYNTLVETLCGIDTCIPCAEFFSKLSALRMTLYDDGLSHLDKEFQVLTKQKSIIVSTDTKNALQSENQGKNRDSKILPPDRARPILIMNSLCIGSDYINAVYVNGYRQKDAYLVTQYPLSNTIYDFWRMVCESKSRTIVLLQSLKFNEMDSVFYWPEENNVFVYDGFKLKCQSTSKGDKISLWNFALYPDSEIDGPPLITSLLHLHTWHIGEICPSDADLILTLLDQTEKRQHQLGKHKVVVQCFDGVAACGIFCAASFLCDKIKTEQDVDVFQAVKSIRASRPEFIKNMEQYNFLYDIAETFLEKFEMYANFQ